MAFMDLYEEKVCKKYMMVCDFLTTEVLIMLVACFIIKNRLLHHYLVSCWNCTILSKTMVI